MTTTQNPLVLLVHGAFAESASWNGVIAALHARGIDAVAVANPLRSLSGDAAYVRDVITSAGRPVVLVGHSYGGFVITGAAERIGARVAAIVYVDALIPKDGQSFADLAPDWDFSGPTLAPPPTAPGDYRDEADRAWVDAKATPQPTGTFTERLRVTGAYERIPRKLFVQATGWDGFGDTARRLETSPGWVVHRIACGHDIAIDRPRELAALLEGVA
jgi:pimeloyl-ACP methyl ester carboxylesterase